MAVDRHARIWNLARGRELFHYVGLDGTPVAVQVSADGKRIAAATSEAVLLVPSDDPSAERVIEIPEQVGAANLVAGGAQILTTSDSGVELWDARSGDRLEYIATSVNDGAHASADLRWVAIPLGDVSDVEIRALHGGAPRARLHSGGQVQWAVFDHGGTRIATVNAAGLIELWTLDGERLAALRGHTAVAKDIEFSPDDRLLVSASNDRTARIWNIASGAELARVDHKDEVDAARFDPAGGRFATASADKYAMLWDTASGAPIRAFSHESAVRSVGLNATYLAGATSSGAVQLWDLASGREAGRFLHTSLVGSVDFAGDRMLSAGDDGRIVVWDVAATVDPPDRVVARVCELVGAGEIATRDLLQCPVGGTPRLP
jgi:WD40 repeat protein